MANYPIESYSGEEIEALLQKIDDLGNASQSSAGLMSAADKTKLDGLDSGAQANVLEGVKIAGADLPITEKKVNIPADSSPTSGSNSLVRSGGVFNAIKDFITRSVNDLVNYYTKTEVNNIIGSLQQFHYEIYASTSAVVNPQSNVLYLIGPTGTGSDKYEEYVYSNGWVKIGDTTIDLSGYVTAEDIETAIQEVPSNYYTKQETSTLIGTSIQSNIVNDVTTGGSTKMLSAEMGKQLAAADTTISEQVSQLGQETKNALEAESLINLAKDFVSGSILSDGSWGASSNFYRTGYIPVQYGHIYYFVSGVANSSVLCIAEYESDHTFISGISASAVARKEFYTPSTQNVAYIAISSRNNTPCAFIDLTNSILALSRESPVKKLGLKVTSNNLANFANIVTDHAISNNGHINELSGWDYVAVDVSQFPTGQNITFGGFYLGRAGFYAFYNELDMAERGIVSYGLFDDPSGTTVPKTVIKPANANWLVFDIKTALSPSNPYSGLMVNLGTTLKQQDTYAAEVEKINGMAIYGTGAADVETLIVDLPVSDGTDIASGYAYIDSTTRTVKVKE